MLRPLRPILILIFFLLGISLCPILAIAQRPPDVEKIRKHEVAAIRFEGDSSISSLELESIIATRTSGWFERFLNSISSNFGTPRQFIDETTLDEDTLRLFVYYRNRGFFDARVIDTDYESKASVAEWEKVNNRNKFLPPEKRESYPLIEDTVVFHIIEGKPYKVAGFTFEGFENLPMDLQNTLTEKIGIKVNSQYSKEALDQETIRARDILGESGYPFISLPYGYTVVERDTLRKTVTISLKFKTGPRIRVGSARVIYDTAFSKNGHVRDNAVLRQVSLDSGAWYKNSEKLSSERYLNRLGTFQSVNIALDTSAFAKIPDSARNGLVLPVIVYLRMRPSFEIVPGPYFGISSFNEFILGVGMSLSDRNIFNGAENFSLQASYQFLPPPSVEQRWSVSSNLVFPYFLDRNAALIWSASFSYAFVAGKYREQITSPSVSSNIELLNDPALRISLLPKLALQYVYREYIDPALRPIGDASLIQPAQFNKIISADLVLDWSNDPLFPSHGSKILWSPQTAIIVPFLESPTLPSAAYIKNTLQFKSYFDLGTLQGRSVLAFRILGGLVTLSRPSDPNRDILFENRYYGGGTSSMRGWGSRTLLVSNNTSPGWPSLGGYKAFETNLEWRYALFHYPAEITAVQQFLSALRIAFFCDVGNVWDKDVPVSPKNFAVALGTGLRYNTLFGALRFDIGLKFYDPYPDPYPPGTQGADKSRNNVLAIPPNSTGVWLFNRKSATKFGDIVNFEFALGQAF